MQFFPLAITGLGAFAPGARTVDTVLALITEGRRVIRPATAAELGFDPQVIVSDRRGVSDRISSLQGAWIGDAGPEVDDQHLDPIFTWSLHLTQGALSDAAAAGPLPARARIGVIAGLYSWGVTARSRSLFLKDYDNALEDCDAVAAELGRLGKAPPRAHPNNGRIAGWVPLEIARRLDLGGPTYALDAACATSHFALKLAALHLAASEADAMLVVAASAGDPLFTSLGFSTLQALPEPGAESRPLDAQSDGLAVGQGGVAFLVQPATAARRCHGIIRSIGLASDGRGQHIVTPNPKGQRRSIERAYAEAGVTPAEIDAVECHATGTRVGDRAEIAILEETFRDRPIPIGAIKSNIGHMLPAAGAFGVLKMLGAMASGMLPPTVGVVDPLEGPSGRFGKKSIPTTPQSWPAREDGRPRRAAVNAFGFGGTNAHLILEESTEGDGLPGPEPLPPTEPLAIVGLEVVLGQAIGRSALRRGLIDSCPTLAPASADRCAGLPAPATPVAALDSVLLDGLSYRLPPTELTSINPQQLLMLAVADSAIRDAGLTQGSRVAVVIATEVELAVHRLMARWEVPGRIAATGADPVDQARLADAYAPATDAAGFLGWIGNLLASRITQLWDFSGPNFTISAEAGGPSRALSIADLLLRAGEADAVVVGAVDLAAGPESRWLAERLGRPTDKVADGAAALVLMPRTTIGERRAYGIIEPPPLAPEPEVEEWVGPAPTGNRLTTTAPASAGVAAGLIAIARAALAIDGGILPAGRIGNRTTVARPWLTAADEMRRAVVTVTDEDGRINRIGLAAAGPPRARVTFGPSSIVPMTVAANDVAGLIAGLEALDRARTSTSSWAGEQEVLFRLAAASLREAAARSDAKVAVGLVARSLDGLGREIARAKRDLPGAFAAGRPWATPDGSLSTPTPLGDTPVAFVYPGIGGIAPGLGADLLAVGPLAIEAIGRVCADPARAIAAERLFPPEPLDGRGRERAEADLAADPAALLSAGVVLAMVSAHTLAARLGLRPAYAAGHSLGEISMLAAHSIWRPGSTWFDRLAGCRALTEGLAGPCRLVADAWGLCDESAVEWDTRVVMVEPSRVREKLQGVDQAYLTHVNGPREVVLAGRRSAIHEVVAALGADAVTGPPKLVVHCAPVAAAAAELIDLLDQPTNAPADSPAFLFAARPEPVVFRQQSSPAGRALAEAVVDGFARPLNFPELIERLWEAGARVFIEVGPTAGVSRWIDETLGDRPHLARPTERQRARPGHAMAALVAGLIAHRVPIACERWAAVLEDETSALGAPPRMPITVSVGGRRVGNRSPTAGPLAEPVGEPAAKAPLTEVPPPVKDAPAPPLSVTAAPSAGIKEPAVLARTADGVADAGTSRPSRPAKLSSDPQAAHAFDPVTESAIARAHQAFLEGRRQVLAVGIAARPGDRVATEAPEPPRNDQRRPLAPAPRRAIVFDEAAVLAFAEGRLAPVLGPSFTAVDALPRRIRVPAPPFMALSRVVELDCRFGKLAPGRIRTEYDVPKNIWHALDGQLPYLALDAQGLLILLSAMGLDLRLRGERVYRWLDGRLTFRDDTPRAGDRIVYDIAIHRFIEDGDTLLLSAGFQASTEGRTFLTIEDCTAGFFTDEELASGTGFANASRVAAPPVGAARPPTHVTRDSLGPGDLERLTAGDLRAVFGIHAAAPRGHHRLRLPPSPMWMVDRVMSITLGGGRFGAGRLEAEKDLDPSHWYIRAHFKDDPVFAGPCMLEGGLQLLRVAALAFGLAHDQPGLRFEPIADWPVHVRFRGQVPGTYRSVFTYRMDVIGIGDRPIPWIAADVDLVHEGRLTGRLEGLALQIVADGDPNRARLVPSLATSKAV